MSQAPGRLNPTTQRLSYALTLPIRLSRWVNATFPRPKINPVSHCTGVADVELTEQFYRLGLLNAAIDISKYGLKWLETTP